MPSATSFSSPETVSANWALTLSMGALLMGEAPGGKEDGRTRWTPEPAF
jgi:hypothetical protein